MEVHRAPIRSAPGRDLALTIKTRCHRQLGVKWVKLGKCDEKYNKNGPKSVLAGDRGCPTVEGERG